MTEPTIDCKLSSDGLGASFDCEWCGSTHHHGRPDGTEHRVSHCAHPLSPPGYYIRIATPEPQA